jgi:hypothetical protein
MKIRPVGAEFFHADGQTDMTKLLVASRNFANAPENESPNIRESKTFEQNFMEQALRIANSFYTIGLYL